MDRILTPFSDAIVVKRHACSHREAQRTLRFPEFPQGLPLRTAQANRQRCGDRRPTGGPPRFGFWPLRSSAEGACGSGAGSGRQSSLRTSSSSCSPDSVISGRLYIAGDASEAVRFGVDNRLYCIMIVSTHDRRHVWYHPCTSTTMRPCTCPARSSRLASGMSSRLIVRARMRS